MMMFILWQVEMEKNGAADDIDESLYSRQL